MQVFDTISSEVSAKKKKSFALLLCSTVSATMSADTCITKPSRFSINAVYIQDAFHSKDLKIEQKTDVHDLSGNRLCEYKPQKLVKVTRGTFRLHVPRQRAVIYLASQSS